MSDTLQSLWDTLVRAELEYLRARQAFLQSRRDSLHELATGLDDPTQRGTALRLLAALPLSAREVLLAQLVDLAAFTHGDIVLVRQLISELNPGWLAEHLPPEIRRVTSSPTATYEEYRRLAEFLQAVNRDLLEQLVTQAMASSDPDIREVGQDFAASV